MWYWIRPTGNIASPLFICVKCFHLNDIISFHSTNTCDDQYSNYHLWSNIVSACYLLYQSIWSSYLQAISPKLNVQHVYNVSVDIHRCLSSVLLCECVSNTKVFVEATAKANNTTSKIHLAGLASIIELELTSLFVCYNGILFSSDFCMLFVFYEHPQTTRILQQYSRRQRFISSRSFLRAYN